MKAVEGSWGMGDRSNIGGSQRIDWMWRLTNNCLVHFLCARFGRREGCRGIEVPKAIIPQEIAEPDKNIFGLRLC